MLFRLLLLAAICALSLMNPARAEELRVLAAGSLREAMTALGDRYREATGISVTAEFGPSGLMRERIEKGEHVDLFASADMGHPLKLLHDGRATRVAMFVRNTLCGVAVPRVGLTTANFIDRLLDPSVKLSTSTPNADPAGDYTWAMFHRIDAQRPGSFAILDKKAQQIVGGPANNALATNNAPAGGKDSAVAALSDGRVDIVIGYCTSARLRLSQMPELQVAEVPREIATGPEYGLAVLKGADSHAPDLALFMLSPEGQQIFAHYGFAPVALPASVR
jgi:molybdate transport system substrate-binding protein